MSKSMWRATLLALAGANLAVAHMQMSFPPPFKSQYNSFSGQNIDYSMTSPLAGDGSNYPCKGYQSLLGTPAGGSTATFAPGSKYNATIVGGASHGGGSCQFSLSYDKGKSFTVIQSVQGGCPVQTSGNFDFSIPSDAPAGPALFAWSWMNNEGNREFYMNCASVTIGGGAKKRSELSPRDTAFSSRPAIFLANLQNGCTTVPSKDPKIPNPGPDFVDNNPAAAVPSGTCGAVVGSGGSGSSAGGSGGSGSDSGSGSGSGSGAGAGAGSGASSSSSAAAASSSPAASSPPAAVSTTSSAAAQAPPASVPALSSVSASAVTTSTPAVAASGAASPSEGGVFVTVPDESATPVSAAPTTLATITTASAGGNGSAASASAPAASAPSASGSAVSSGAGSSGSGSSGSGSSGSGSSGSGSSGSGSSGSGSSGSSSGAAGAMTGACTNEGAWNCIGGTSFQRCASGAWSATIAMAAGTSCKPGVSDTLTYAKEKRNEELPKRPFGRRAGARRFANTWVL